MGFKEYSRKTKASRLFNSTDVDQYFICHYEGEYPVINCPLRHTLSDVRSIIHEFFHFYNMQGRFDKGSSAFELNEFASIFFETVAGNYLLSKEFDEAVVRDLLQWRISDIERIKNRKTFMDLLRTVIEDGEINEENFASVREQLEVQFCRLLKPARYVGNSKLERTLYVVSNFETWKKFSIKLTYVIGAVLTNDIIESKGLTEGSRLVLQNMDKINNINYSVEEVMELFKEDGYTPFAKEQPKVKKIIPPKNSVE